MNSAIVDKLAAWLKGQTERYLVEYSWESNKSRLYLQRLGFLKREVRCTFSGFISRGVSSWFSRNAESLPWSEWSEIALAAYDVEVKRLEGLLSAL